MSPTLLAAALLLVLAACATPIGVRQADSDAVHRTLAASAISAREPSTFSRQVLARFNLISRFADDPDAALTELHASLPPTGGSNRIFALAELSFLRAVDTGSRERYLATVVYAYAFLFPAARENTPDAMDPRARLAADLYNLALAEAFRQPEGNELALAAGIRALPFGALEVTLDADQLRWAERRLERFVSATTLEVYGLRNRYRQAGLGAPLAASLGDPVDEAPRRGSHLVPDRLKVSVTMFLRLDGTARQLRAGQLRGRIELYTQDDKPSIEVEGRQVPLEYEPTAALAATLDRAPVWDSEYAAFLQGDFRARGKGSLGTLTPYRPGRIPVVLVHGTASSVARWAQLINELNSDHRIASRCQFWIFTYNTGNPLLYSAMLLRESLRGAVTELDPLGTDAGLRRMVVIGHSQGGLLTKLLVVDSGTRFWDALSQSSFDDLKVSDETRQTLRQALFVTPLPFIERVVFMATPHRGSETAARVIQYFRGLVMRLVSLPADLVRMPAEIIEGSDDPKLRRTLRDGLPRSVESMSPRSPTIRTLQFLPVASNVSAHSIIAVKGGGPVESGDDGFVAYESAHVDGVASERVVRSDHSVQDNPEAIEEVRRILLEHLAGP